DSLGNFFAGSLFDTYRSTDDGINWNLAETGIPANAGGFAVKTLGQVVFVGNSAGVFYSNDYGATYTSASEGLDAYPNNAVQGFTVKGDTLFAGLFRNAVWKRPLSDFGIATLVDHLSSNGNDFKVISFNSTSIVCEVRLGNASDVELQMVDMLGRVMKNISLG